MELASIDSMRLATWTILAIKGDFFGEIIDGIHTSSLQVPLIAGNGIFSNHRHRIGGFFQVFPYIKLGFVLIYPKQLFGKMPELKRSCRKTRFRQKTEK